MPHSSHQFRYLCAKKMLKKLLVISILLGLFAPFALTFLSIQHRKKEVKRALKWNMIAGLDKSDLVQLSFSFEELETELTWKHSREFQYKGQMYDIVYIKASEDSVHYDCWWDHEETKLNQQLQDLLALVFGKDPVKRNEQDHLTQFLKQLYCYSSSSQERPESHFSKLKASLNYKLLSPFLKKESPPPRA